MARLHRLTISLLLISLVSASANAAFADFTELKTAYNQWCDDRSAVESKYGPIGQWDVSRVTTLAALFCELLVCQNHYDPPSNPKCIGFNKDISGWDISRVTSLTYTFAGARSFNQPLAPWDTSRVTRMGSTFDAAESFNQPLTWNTAKVTDMGSMFRLAKAFNQPSVQDFDTSNVVNMRSTFHLAVKFNQPLPWNTKNTKEMKDMFAHAKSFDQPLNWDVSNVDRFEGTFDDTTSLSDCNKAHIHAVFEQTNPKLKCLKEHSDGHHTCSIGHGVASDTCDGCGGYDHWGNLPACGSSPPAPPYRAPTWWDENGQTVIVIVAAVVGVILLLILGWLLMRRVKAWRVRRSAKMQEHARAIESEYEASVHFALRSLPLTTFSKPTGQAVPPAAASSSASSSGAAGIELNETTASSIGSTSQSASGLDDVKNSIVGWFSPTPSEEEAGRVIAARGVRGRTPPEEKTYSKTTAKVMQQPYQETECPICLSTFQDGEEIRTLPCGHSFKRACIDDWLKTKGRQPPKPGAIVKGLASCPLCKVVPLDVPDPRKLTDPPRPRGFTTATV